MNKVIIIAGSGRSGTTWIQDAIAGANDMRTLFEPLHPVGVPWSQGLSYRYLEADDDADDLRAFLDIAFAGRMKSLWANYRIRPDRFSLMKYRPGNVIHNFRKMIRHYPIYRPVRGKEYKGLVVKFIRANLILPWLERNYDHPILFVTRHPGAVISSILSIGTEDWSAERAITRYTGNPRIVKHMQRDYNFDISRAMSPAATLACVWCIENVPVLRRPAGPQTVIATYESLLANPHSEWARIGKALGLEHLPSEQHLASPSQQSAKDKRNKPFDRTNLGKWRNELGPGQIDDIRKVLDAFGVDFYDIDNDMPVAEILPTGTSS